MSKDPRHLRGKQGEDVATCFLEANGFQVLERNSKVFGVEVDIIAVKERVLYFVEVKTSEVLEEAAFKNLRTKQMLRLRRAALRTWQAERARYLSVSGLLVMVTCRGTSLMKLPLLYDRT
jgi:Holliday junction resolvase-like predicted endonuclease